MKIGLTQAFLEKSADFTNSYTLASISAWIKKTMPGVKVTYSMDTNELLDCDEVWVTSTSDAWNKVNELGEVVTGAGKKFIAGGHHATALPQTLRYGTTFRGPLEVYGFIDELPLPDWSIFKEAKKHLMMTSRGCPYDCNFCSSKSFWKKYQAKSPEKVIKEIKYLKSLGAKEINIFDDLFTANRERIKKIVDLINQEHLYDIEYSCLVRSNLIDQPIIDLLKKMGIKHLAFGAESGSNRVLDLMNKKATVEDNQRAIDLFFDNGFRPTLSFIVGYPGETLDDLELTRRFIEKNRSKCDIIEIYPCIPFPGTRLWAWFVEHNNINSLGNFNWESLSLNLGNIDWDKYRMLTDKYNKDDLINIINWNEAEKRLKNSGITKEDINLTKEVDSKNIIFPESALAHKYCIGKGLEIGGSAHNPFGLKTLNVDVTDSMDTVFKKEEIRLCGKALNVDIVANGDNIPLPDESQDFIVSSHVIEHFPNPIKALIEWDRLVKKGGIIFMIVPHKERTFDRGKESTPLTHLIEDFKNDNTKSHNDPHGQDHCWATKDFVELINYMIKELDRQWELIDVQDIDDKVGNGFTIVIKKKGESDQRL